MLLFDESYVKYSNQTQRIVELQVSPDLHHDQQIHKSLLWSEILVLALDCDSQEKEKFLKKLDTKKTVS